MLVIATTAIFAIRLLNITNSIDDLTARVTILHDKYCAHEDRIECNYKSLAELNRRQDEWMRQHAINEEVLNKEIQALRERKTLPRKPTSIKPVTGNDKFFFIMIRFC